MNNSFLTEIYKPSVDQSVLDEAANVVLAYCMAAMFLVKNQQVRLLPSHFLKLLEYMERGKNSVNFESMESASTTHDQITLNAPVSDEVRNYILDTLTDRTAPEFCMVRSIIDFLNNNANFNSIVAQTTNNGILNRIVIDVDNVSVEEPQTTTVMIDNEHVSLFNRIMPIYDFRTGIGGIGQKDLQKDYGYDSHRKFLNYSFGVDIGPDSAVYYQTSHNNGNPSAKTVEAATRQLYEEISKRINQGFDGAFDSTLRDFKHEIISSMLGCCYGVNTDDDCTCLVMPNNKVKHDSFDVQDLYQKLYNANLRAKCPENVNPSIRIVDGDNKELFQVRFKKEKYKDNLTGHRYKMYFKPSKLRDYY